MRYFLSVVLALSSLLAISQHPQRTLKSSGELYLKLKKASKPVRVLYVAAHPDDENTRVIGWLENHRNVETAYFSFTRGDGGQNLIGTEKGPLLGVLRTQELLEARKIDGARQFFSHAIDFGYSKSAEETLEIWDKEQVLGDLVYIIRYFQPDVILTRFPGDRAAGHGHHEASALLAAEAFEFSGNPNKFPEQLKELEPWSPLRLVWNSYSWRRDPKMLDEDVMINVDAPVAELGFTTGEIASRARSMHKCQGFGRAWDRGEIKEYFKFLNGQPFSNDILENINPSWSRFNNGRAVDQAFSRLLQKFNYQSPWQSAGDIVATLKALKNMDKSARVLETIAELEKCLAAALQIHIEATTNQSNVVAGDSLDLELNMSSALKQALSLSSIEIQGNQTLTPFFPFSSGISYEEKIRIRVPENTNITSPYWLSNQASLGSYQFSNSKLLRLAENKAPLQAKFYMEYNGYNFSIETPIYRKNVAPDYGEQYFNLSVLDQVTLSFTQQLLISLNGEASYLEFTVKNNSDKAFSDVLDFTLPRGWTSDDHDIQINLEPKEAKDFKIKLSPSEQALNDALKFYWQDAQTPVLQLQRVDYPHIMEQVIQTGASVQLSSVYVKTTNKLIGYIPGAGDEIPSALTMLGYRVDMLDQNTFNNADLSKYSCIVTGIRAYNTQDWLADKAEELWNYAENGGHLLVQYNTLNFLSSIKAPIAPSNLKLGRSRVTKEEAEMRILQPKHPVLNSPNKIGTADFENWVQERGLYFAEEWSEDFTPIFSTNDPDEEPSEGALLVGDFGRGKITYCGISFFRQLPAGVPGAYRLFANLVEL